MAGGMGGSQSTSIEIPEWLQQAAQANLAKATEISKTPFAPYYGPDVAAMTPLQQAGMANTNMGASAFGLGGTPSPMAGMPTAQTFANGMQGYSSGGLYDQALATLQARNPGTFAALNAPFINSVTGAQPSAPYGTGGSGGAAPAQQPVREMTWQERRYKEERQRQLEENRNRVGGSDR
jgi:hypothetical protein